jgi:hypothetical protein
MYIINSIMIVIIIVIIINIVIVIVIIYIDIHIYIMFVNNITCFLSVSYAKVDGSFSQNP